MFDVAATIYLASYKGTHAGWQGLINRGIRWLTKSQYSHTEVCVGNPFESAVPCLSSSGVDGGVRIRRQEHRQRPKARRPVRRAAHRLRRRPRRRAAANAGAQPTQPNGGRTHQTGSSAEDNHQATRQHTELIAALAGLNRSTTVQLSTADIEAQMRGLVSTMQAHVKEVATQMPIVVNVPEQAAPVVNVNVPEPVVNVAAPVVNLDATVPPAQVVVQHPTRAVQTVKRDANDEITQTVTDYTIETRD